MKVCPKCGKSFERLLAVSREDNKTMICDGCGIDEALSGFLPLWREQIKEILAEVN